MQTKKREFFAKGFVYLSVLYFAVTLWGLPSNFVTWRNMIIGNSIFAFFVFCLSLFPLVFGRFIMIGVIFISCVLFLIDLFCFYWFETPSNLNMFLTAFETTYQETLSFLEAYLSWKFLLACFGFVFISVGYWMWFKPSFLKKARVFVYCYCIFGLINLVIHFVAMNKNGYHYWAREEINYMLPLKFATQIAYAKEEGERMIQAFEKQREEILSHQKLPSNKLDMLGGGGREYCFNPWRISTERIYVSLWVFQTYNT